MLWLPESARWLITSQKYEKARVELRRAARINGKLTDDTDSKIDRFNRQVLREEAVSSNGNTRMGLWRSILAIFTNLHILKDTLSVFILLFVAEVVYFSLTLNVADLGGSLYINYVISGLSELVSIAFCGTLLAYLSRRMCLSLLLLASTVSYLMLSLVNVYEDHLSMTFILMVNAFGKLTAIGNLMVIILVSQEVFPTVIRQFGTSLSITVGKAGSAVAPFTHELGQIIGQSWCFAMFSLICLSCAVIPFILSETGNRELPDTVIDVEEGVDNARKKKRQINSKKPAQYVAHYQSTGSPINLKDFKDVNNNDSSNLKDVNGFNSFDYEIKQKMLDEDDLSRNNSPGGKIVLMQNGIAYNNHYDSNNNSNSSNNNNNNNNNNHNNNNNNNTSAEPRRRPEQDQSDISQNQTNKNRSSDTTKKE